MLTSTSNLSIDLRNKRRIIPPKFSRRPASQSQPLLISNGATTTRFFSLLLRMDAYVTRPLIGHVSKFFHHLFSKVYIHDARDCSLRTVCAKADAPLVSLDLSLNGNYFQVSTNTNELHFYSVLDGTRVASPAVVRDTKWASITVPLGWNVQGCWKSAGGDSNERNAVDDAEHAPRFLKSIITTNEHPAPFVTSVHRSPSSRLLAKGCADGTVAVYNYPAHAPGMAMVRVIRSVAY